MIKGEINKVRSRGKRDYRVNGVVYEWIVGLVKQMFYKNNNLKQYGGIGC